jgi:hypothetical protein
VAHPEFLEALLEHRMRLSRSPWNFAVAVG